MSSDYFFENFTHGAHQIEISYKIAEDAKKNHFYNEALLLSQVTYKAFIEKKKNKEKISDDEMEYVADSCLMTIDLTYDKEIKKPLMGKRAKKHST